MKGRDIKKYWMESNDFIGGGLWTILRRED